jgi:uncharacterized membrane protein YphA (DoxX/SURF4 family)
MSTSVTLEREYADASRVLPSGAWPDALILLNRLALGWYVMNAGWDKVQAEVGDGLGAFLNGNLFQRRSTILPDMLQAPFGYAWPWLELTCGLLLIVGLFGRTTAAVTAWLLSSISITLLATDGDYFPRHYLMVFVPVALLLYVSGPGRYSLDALVESRRTARGNAA